MVDYPPENNAGVDMRDRLKKRVRRWQVEADVLAVAFIGGQGEHLANVYNAVIVATLEFLDETTGKAISGHYPAKYDRSTPLHKLGIPAKLRPTLAQAYDDKVRMTLMAQGHPVEGARITSDDMRHVTTIEGLYRMACGIYSVPAPQG